MFYSQRHLCKYNEQSTFSSINLLNLVQSYVHNYGTDLYLSLKRTKMQFKHSPIRNMKTSYLYMSLPFSKQLWFTISKQNMTGLWVSQYIYQTHFEQRWNQTSLILKRFYRRQNKNWRGSLRSKCAHLFI